MEYRTSYALRHFARHLFLNSRGLPGKGDSPTPSRLEADIQESMEDYILLPAHFRNRGALSQLQRQLHRIEKRLEQLPRSRHAEGLLLKARILNAEIKRMELRGL